MKLEAVFRLASSNTVVLTLNGEPPDKKKPYARIELNYVWDAGTLDARILPTLGWLFVPPRLRGQGYGVQVLNLVLTFMRKRRIPYLVFDNFNEEFWNSAANALPGQIRFFQKKRLGALFLRPTAAPVNPWANKKWPKSAPRKG